jgi:hypothetical protein
VEPFAAICSDVQNAPRAVFHTLREHDERFRPLGFIDDEQILLFPGTMFVTM